MIGIPSTYLILIDAVDWLTPYIHRGEQPRNLDYDPQTTGIIFNNNKVYPINSPRAYVLAPNHINASSLSARVKEKTKLTQFLTEL